MLNTDRGADNYMIKYCEGDHSKSLVDVAPSRTSRPEMPMMTELRRADTIGSGHTIIGTSTPPSYAPTYSSNLPYTKQPHIHIAAIDNSLSFPHVSHTTMSSLDSSDPSSVIRLIQANVHGNYANAALLSLLVYDIGESSLVHST